MKVYIYSVRRKPGTEELVPYRRGPFASYEEWREFLNTRAGRKMGTDYAAIDEESDPPVMLYSAHIRVDPLALPYPFLISKHDGALITSKGTLVFEGGPR